ncbi:peptidoglycan glycosyltransferase [Kribbella orskensis]|uniref:Peptidoglycan glycosyltransferase n=1 Tax=Kribbella orskensis TaxID=2512216 RepID=A0ABY2BPS0_9ACTN|nr:MULTISPECIES: penicillin-binding transpeptidase domain-containing protein [Kribbella]TCN39629.1 peptidoglycan glycosyltransferase [Kribbella sp. VKM Ac-2500]TCO27589.1 peptidoglycan glycosyltransferase [Kribbella orskensis]
MNSAIRRLAVAAIILMLALMANSTYLQAFRAGDLNGRNDNRRVRDDQFSVNRGPILIGSTPIAQSKPSNDRFEFQRSYPSGPVFAPVTGYYSYLYGRSAIELTQNSQLNGSDPSMVFRRVVDVVTDRRQQGASVSLTLNAAAQQAAYKGLAGKKGAVVAIEPKTGKVLALVSRPSYDPNELASHDLTKVNAAWKRLNEDPDKPMSNRAIKELYPPGSTFKLVTSAAALSSGKYNPETKVHSPAELPLPQTTVPLVNENGRNCGGSDNATLTVALRNSCNTAFGTIGLDLGPDALRDQAEKFGFGERQLPELGAVASQFPTDPNQPQTAQSAIGQFDVRATPLQMAMVAAGIANQGDVMKPYLVQSVRTADLKTVSETKPESLHQAITPEVASQLTAMMVDVVENGTGKPGRIDGVQVAGKTGTAQTSKEKPPFAWFTSFAPANDPKVAVAVMIEDANVARDDISGGALAAPIAKSVMEAVLGQ